MHKFLKQDKSTFIVQTHNPEWGYVPPEVPLGGWVAYFCRSQTLQMLLTLDWLPEVLTEPNPHGAKQQQKPDSVVKSLYSQQAWLA